VELSFSRLPRAVLTLVLTVAFLIALLVLQALGAEQSEAFVMTFGVFAYALVVLFTVQRLRRPT
jgi:hypothetical protein